MHQIEINELPAQLPALLASLAGGAEVIVTQAAQPVAKLVRYEAEQTAAPSNIWAKLDALVEQLPPEVIAQLPADASVNLDHYLYGAPKR